MPSQNYIQDHFGHQEGSRVKKPTGVFDHHRSNSTGPHAAKTITSNSPPAKSKLHRDPYDSNVPSTSLYGSNRSLRSLKEEHVKPASSKSSWTSSRKSSICSLDTDSSPERRSRANSTDKKGRVQEHGGSNQRHRGSNDKLPQGYSSGESRARTRQSPSKGKGIGDIFSNIGTPSKSPNLGGRGTSDASSRRSSKISSSSGDNAQSRAQRHLRLSHSSSDGAGRQKMPSPSVFCKDDDPSYVHNSINLYLDMEIFDGAKGESFRMAFRSPVEVRRSRGAASACGCIELVCLYIQDHRS